MARSDLILTLVRAGMAGDRALLRATVEALAAEERAAKHTTLADRLAQALSVNGSAAHVVANGVYPGREFVAEAAPQRKLEDLMLTAVAQRQASDLIEEQRRADLLRSHGLQPRHRVLLSGPPGNGKTVLAEAVAEALALPFLSVRYDALIGSYLGETTQRLRKLFDYVRTVPCVLLFDEFDAIAKERGDVHETGEIKRVVSSLLLQIDSLPSTVVVMAATNHSELLDRAVWRRFQVRLAMPAPSRGDLVRFLAKAFSTSGEARLRDTREIADSLWPVSYAEAAEFLIDVRRRHVLSLGEKRFAEFVTEQLALWSARAQVDNHGERSDKTPFALRPAEADPAHQGSEANAAVPTPVPSRSAAKGARPQARRPRTGTGKRRRSADAAE